MARGWGREGDFEADAEDGSERFRVPPRKPSPYVTPEGYARLKDEYSVDASFEPVQVATARWIRCGNAKKLEEFREKAAMNLALDAAGQLVYLAPTRVNLQLMQERWPDVEFLATREHAHAVAID